MDQVILVLFVWNVFACASNNLNSQILMERKLLIIRTPAVALYASSHSEFFNLNCFIFSSRIMLCNILQSPTLLWAQKCSPLSGTDFVKTWSPRLEISRRQTFLTSSLPVRVARWEFVNYFSLHDFLSSWWLTNWSLLQAPPCSVKCWSSIPILNHCSS